MATTGSSEGLIMDVRGRVRAVLRGRPATLIAGLVAGGLLVSGVAYAAIPDPAGTIHGCYTKTTPHVLRVVDTATTPNCPAGTVALNWSQTGPAGPKGPAGPANATWWRASSAIAPADGSYAVIDTITVSSAGSYRVDGFAYVGAPAPAAALCRIQYQDVASGVFPIMDNVGLVGTTTQGLALDQEARQPFSGAFNTTGATPVQVSCQTSGGQDLPIAVRLTVEQVTPLVASNS